MRYKVGDKVRVRSDLVVGRKYGTHTFKERMVSSRGAKLRVVEVYPNTFELVGYPEVGFTNDMLEKVEEDKNENSNIRS